MRQLTEVQMQTRELRPVELFLIEDNPADVQLIWHVLAESDMKVNVHIAMDGAQALQMLADPEFRPNLIVLDLNIPKIRGLDLLERLSGKIPVVVFSSTTDEREKQRALELGASDFASKPSDLQKYAEAVCGMVRKWALPHQNRNAAEA
jgi:two-component system, chemotaxis family, response regulator Rcp1